jgi:hypothetical protein
MENQLPAGEEADTRSSTKKRTFGDTGSTSLSELLDPSIGPRNKRVQVAPGVPTRRSDIDFSLFALQTTGKPGMFCSGTFMLATPGLDQVDVCCRMW